MFLSVCDVHPGVDDPLQDPARHALHFLPPRQNPRRLRTRQRNKEGVTHETSRRVGKNLHPFKGFFHHQLSDPVYQRPAQRSGHQRPFHLKKLYLFCRKSDHCAEL